MRQYTHTHTHHTGMMYLESMPASAMTPTASVSVLTPVDSSDKLCNQPIQERNEVTHTYRIAGNVGEHFKFGEWPQNWHLAIFKFWRL